MNHSVAIAKENKTASHFPEMEGNVKVISENGPD
jgi:hypothetical protein